MCLVVEWRRGRAEVGVEALVDGNRDGGEEGAIGSDGDAVGCDGEEGVAREGGGGGAVVGEEGILHMGYGVREEERLREIEGPVVGLRRHGGAGTGGAKRHARGGVAIDESLADGIETSLQLNNWSSLFAAGEHVIGNGNANDTGICAAHGAEEHKSVAQKETVANTNLAGLLQNDASVVHIASYHA